MLVDVAGFFQNRMSPRSCNRQRIAAVDALVNGSVAEAHTGTASRVRANDAARPNPCRPIAMPS
jgi:hypothetical protein